ncbi:GNAT family N-acetyltransferase [Catellatospora tritici]|uniref:GNAT family N-acetyltransferase n=1 Tax=Catellatospora tritici TaxID=2851566 RepID=UPI001C2CD939|nr:GNAT family N-acetyltransferase [Catellatospora tritici]MBV1856188.1 GNAT family N-acetyltransferase [Catellatospora tritici]
MRETITARRGGPDDIPAVLSLLDVAVEWLVAQGRTGQWGTGPQSTSPRRLAQAEQWARAEGFWIAETGGVVVGALVVGLPADFAPAPSEPDLYVNLLVADRRRPGQGIGAFLLDHARALARAAGIGLLRLDCHDAGDRALVHYYERQGFTATHPLTFGEWTGRVLEQRL